MSLIRYGIDTVNAVCVNVVLVTIMNCMMPDKWHNRRPAIHRLTAVILFFKFLARPHIITKGIKPNMNPPVTPKSVPKPLLKAENTGRPIAPIVIYRPTDTVPAFTPSIRPVITIASVCSVAGTPDGIGIASWDITAIIAVNIPVYAICFVRDAIWPPILFVYYIVNRFMCKYSVYYDKINSE